MRVAVRIRSYEELQSALSARRRQLGLRCSLELDEKSGLMKEADIQARSSVGIRRLGPISLPNLLAALDCDLLLAPRSSTAAPVERTGSAGLVRHLPRTGDPS